MIIGTLPVVLPVFANLLYSQRDGKLPWRRLFPALICIAVGLICVNVAELRQGLPNFSPWRYGSGIALLGWLLGCLRNARWLRENPHQPPMMWATAQALVTLPVSLAGYLAACAAAVSRPGFPALRPASGGVYYVDAGHRGALLMGRRAMLEYCQPAAADGDPRPAYRL